MEGLGVPSAACSRLSFPFSGRFPQSARSWPDAAASAAAHQPLLQTPVGFSGYPVGLVFLFFGPFFLLFLTFSSSWPLKDIFFYFALLFCSSWVCPRPPLPVIVVHEWMLPGLRLQSSPFIKPRTSTPVSSAWPDRPHYFLSSFTPPFSLLFRSPAFTHFPHSKLPALTPSHVQPPISYETLFV